MSDYIYYNNLTDKELFDLVDEAYYSIGATGAQALEALRYDIPAWESKHGVPQARMEVVLGWFEAHLIDNGYMDKVCGVIYEDRTQGRKRASGVARIIKKIKQAGR